MKVAITGATGFIGGQLADRLEAEVHETVRLDRLGDEANNNLVLTDLSDVDSLTRAFDGCRCVAHCAGINREIGDQTFHRVHIEGTRNVVEAAKRAGVRKIVLMSFLRARPNCGSPYHESKWAAEEIVRYSGLDYTIIKAGIVYGRGDHMLDHLSHALHTFPLFATVGFEEKTVRPLAVEDLTQVMRAALIDNRMKGQTVAALGPEEIYLSEAVRRVADVIGHHPLMFPLPVWCHKLMALVFERTMTIPLTSQSQVRILSEGVVNPATPVSKLPYDLLPTRRFTTDQIRNGLPKPAAFCVTDLRWCH
ncbi:MAG TPA: NAD-dependent epimerase/dehydratase family protein [Pyrinomonadaceae bacterium]|nr:NAD-dependent epimerase/dehydratase family protein [Pyrinomonadaceae bacterium]